MYYCDGEGKYQQEFLALFNEHVPRGRDPNTVAGKLLFAACNIYYVGYNNGFLYDTTEAWEFIWQTIPNKTEVFENSMQVLKRVVGKKDYIYFDDGDDIAEALEALMNGVVEYILSNPDTTQRH